MGILFHSKWNIGTGVLVAGDGVLWMAKIPGWIKPCCGVGKGQEIGLARRTIVV